MEKGENRDKSRDETAFKRVVDYFLGHPKPKDEEKPRLKNPKKKSRPKATQASEKRTGD